MKEREAGSAGFRMLPTALWLVAAVGAIALLVIVGAHDPEPSIARLAFAWRRADAVRILRTWEAAGQIW